MSQVLPQNQSPVKVLWHDKLLAATVLKLIPQTVTPNHVTVFRLLATPAVLWLLWIENYWLGIPVFLLVAFTDAIDGSMARTRNQVTQWGTLYDPVADKFLIGSVLALVVVRKINVVLGLTLIAIEIIFIIGGLIRLRRGIIRPANVWGKIKMILECAGVTILLIAIATGHSLILNISAGTLALAVVFALISLVTHGI